MGRTKKPERQPEDDQMLLAKLALMAQDTDERESVVGSSTDSDSSDEGSPRKDWVRGLAQRATEPDYKQRMAKGTFVYVKPALQPGRHFYVNEYLENLLAERKDQLLRRQIRGKKFRITGTVLFDKAGDPEAFEVENLSQAPEGPSKVLSQSDPNAPTAALVQGSQAVVDAAAEAVLSAAEKQKLADSSPVPAADTNSGAAASSAPQQAPVIAARGPGSTSGSLNSSRSSMQSKQSKTARRAYNAKAVAEQEAAASAAPAAGDAWDLTDSERGSQADEDCDTTFKGTRTLSKDPRERMRARKIQAYSTSEEDEEVVTARRARREAERETQRKAQQQATVASSASQQDLQQEGASGESDSDGPLGKATQARALAITKTSPQSSVQQPLGSASSTAKSPALITKAKSLEDEDELGVAQRVVKGASPVKLGAAGAGAARMPKAWAGRRDSEDSD